MTIEQIIAIAAILKIASHEEISEAVAAITPGASTIIEGVSVERFGDTDLRDGWCFPGRNSKWFWESPTEFALQLIERVISFEIAESLRHE